VAEAIARGADRAGPGFRAVLTVLHVAYPLAPVDPDAVGGVEQVLFHLEQGLAMRGCRTIVVGREDSRVCGTLIGVPIVPPPYDEATIATVRQRSAEAIRTALEGWAIDLVHMHGFDFNTYLPPPDVPVLATLHCPSAWYAPSALHPARRGIWLNAVSARQNAELQPNSRLLGFVENGAPAELFTARHARRAFALLLGRIAPDKGVREALLAARAADMPLLVAGELYPYPEHQRYFTTEIAPLLDVKRRYIGPVGFRRKRRLLAAARCVLIPSLVPETSSLVLRESFAAGTPVIAFRKGAVVDAIACGRTGFLVDTVDDMAAAMRRASELDGNACRQVAREHFSLERMVEGYLELYQRVLQLSTATEYSREAAL